ncbi:suppression of tumorigenicity 5 [Pelomyxa schiedti]|nr:suppression of tumorigenicity 5 [Pelomyxa schiedti]
MSKPPKDKGGERTTPAEAQLFDHVLLIQLTEKADGSAVPHVSYRFPPLQDDRDRDRASQDSAAFVQFCFPEERPTQNSTPASSSPSPRPNSNSGSTPPNSSPLSSSVSATPSASTSTSTSSSTPASSGVANSSSVQESKPKSETFSFVMTSGDGTKQFGYCRRFIHATPPECFCIISHVPSYSLFCKLLDIIESRRKTSSAVFNFLKAVLAHPFPAPGDSFVVRTFSCTSTSGMDEYTIMRPASEMLLDYVSFRSLFGKLTVSKVVKLWGCLLCERRVVITSENLELLSSCVNAFCALLFPFSWQHVFIPILPKSLIGYLSAPMPFLIGCLHSSIALVKKTGIPLEEIYLVDLDTGAFLLKPTLPDLLPVKPASLLRNALTTILSGIDLGTENKEIDNSISRTFFHFFRKLFSGYNEFFTADPEIAKAKRRPKEINFDVKGFIGAHKGDEQSFLEAFEGSQIFWMFINEREDMAIHGDLTKQCALLVESDYVPPFRSYTLGVGKCFQCNHIFKKDQPCSIYKEKYWHTKCFVCSMCGINLEGDTPCGSKKALMCGECFSFAAEFDSGAGTKNTPQARKRRLMPDLPTSFSATTGAIAATTGAFAATTGATVAKTFRRLQNFKPPSFMHSSTGTREEHPAPHSDDGAATSNTSSPVPSTASPSSSPSISPSPSSTSAIPSAPLGSASGSSSGSGSAATSTSTSTSVGNANSQHSVQGQASPQPTSGGKGTATEPSSDGTRVHADSDKHTEPVQEWKSSGNKETSISPKLDDSMQGSLIGSRRAASWIPAVVTKTPNRERYISFSSHVPVQPQSIHVVAQETRTNSPSELASTQQLEHQQLPAALLEQQQTQQQEQLPAEQQERVQPSQVPLEPISTETNAVLTPSPPPSSPPSHQPPFPTCQQPSPLLVSPSPSLSPPPHMPHPPPSPPPQQSPSPPPQQTEQPPPVLPSTPVHPCKVLPPIPVSHPPSKPLPTPPSQPPPPAATRTVSPQIPQHIDTTETTNVPIPVRVDTPPSQDTNPLPPPHSPEHSPPPPQVTPTPTPTQPVIPTPKPEPGPTPTTTPTPATPTATQKPEPGPTPIPTQTTTAQVVSTPPARPLPPRTGRPLPAIRCAPQPPYNNPPSTSTSVSPPTRPVPPPNKPLPNNTL